MKKMFLIGVLSLFLFVPTKIMALEEHEDYFNYAIETYAEQIKQYKYHLFYKDTYKQYTLILSTDPLLNSTTFDRIDFNFSNYTGKYIVANKTNDYIADLSTITSSFNGITVYYSDYDVKNSLNKVSFAKNYTFVETPVDPSPSPSPSPSPDPSPDAPGDKEAISREEYYVGLALLALIPCMLFLRWIYPMKGGRNI